MFCISLILLFGSKFIDLSPHIQQICGGFLTADRLVLTINFRWKTSTIQFLFTAVSPSCHLSQPVMLSLKSFLKFFRYQNAILSSNLSLFHHLMGSGEADNHLNSMTMKRGNSSAANSFLHEDCLWFQIKPGNSSICRQAGAQCYPSSFPCCSPPLILILLSVSVLSFRGTASTSNNGCHPLT